MLRNYSVSQPCPVGLPVLEMHVSSVLIELLTNGGGHMEPRPVEMIINIINMEWSVCSSPARHASVYWD